MSQKAVSRANLESMTDVLQHRGPDGFGHVVNSGFGFGHRRLAIVDLSDAGIQPLTYMDKYVITYNGEIYNHLELREELESEGYAFKTTTDTEVIIAAYDFWGHECLSRFNGMWAFAIADTVKQRIFIARDRFGIKPLYYTRTKDAYLFASEIKSLFEHPEVSRDLDVQKVKHYLQDGPKEYEECTVFRRIKKFKSASYIECKLNELAESEIHEIKFWELTPNLNIEKYSHAVADEYAKKYYTLLEDAVRIRLRSDVKVGSALSGGLDSSSIVYLVNSIQKEAGIVDKQETFSSVYKSAGTEDCDESKYIDRLAADLAVKSNQIEPEEEQIPEQYLKMIRAIETPPESTLMSSWYTFLCVSKTDVKVTLDGQGADEQLAGYIRYVMVYLISLKLSDLYRQIPKYISIPNSKKFLLAGFILKHVTLLVGRSNTQRLIKRWKGWDIEINLNGQLALDFNTSLQTLLHYADHTSMAHSIESRMPFMDYRLVEFLASVPGCYKIRDGWTKYIARKAFDGKLPNEICWRKDMMGWPIPEKKWFEGDLKQWMDKNLELFKLNIAPRIQYENNIENLSLKEKIRCMNVATVQKLFSAKLDNQ